MKPYTRLETSMQVLAYIAAQGEGKVVSVRRIAAFVGKSHRYIDSIAVGLRDSGFLIAFRGIEGGYALARAPHTISYLEPVKMVFGSLGLTRCSETDAAPLCAGCKAAGACPFRDAAIRARRAAEFELEQLSFAWP
jgi:Rrf2 family protein